LKTKILKYVLAALFLIVSFLAWRSVDRAVNVPGAGIWAVPVSFFSAYFVLAYLNAIVIKRTEILQWLFSASILLSFIFVHSLGHLNAVFAAYVFLAWGITRIMDDVRLNIWVSLWKSIRAGNTLVLLAVSFMIASQYYASAKNFDADRIVPQFRVSSISGNLTSKILTLLNPDLKDISQEGLTVDQFISQIQEGQGNDVVISSAMDIQIDQAIEKSNPGLTDAQKKILKDETLKKAANTSVELGREQQILILQEGRRKFSEIYGSDLTGDEKIADVFSGIVNRKIDQYFSSESVAPGKTSSLPAIMAIGLFLTVLSLGSALSPIWILLAGSAFWIFRRTGLVRIIRVPVEMEIIE